MVDAAKEIPVETSDANAFYRKYYYFLVWGLIALIVLVVIGVSIVFYQAYNRPLPPFYAAKPDGQRMDLVAAMEPNLLSSTILAWGSKAATLAYSFDYVHYNEQLALARPYFTEAGWRDYLISVDALIDTIVQNQLIVNGVVSGTPVISNQGPLPSTGFTWRLQIPFLVTYQTANTTTRRNYMVILTIVRVPTSTNPQGIGVDQFVMTAPGR